jgi:predicted ABC-type exoprotein transport system permease subunit
MKVKIEFGKGYIKTYTVYSYGMRNQKLLCLWNTFLVVYAPMYYEYIDCHYNLYFGVFS